MSASYATTYSFRCNCLNLNLLILTVVVRNTKESHLTANRRSFKNTPNHWHKTQAKWNKIEINNASYRVAESREYRLYYTMIRRVGFQQPNASAFAITSAGDAMSVMFCAISTIFVLKGIFQRCCGHKQRCNCAVAPRSESEAYNITMIYLLGSFFHY